MRRAHLGVAVTGEARAKISAAKLGARCPDGCTCKRHDPRPATSTKCPVGCTCGRHKARLPEGSQFAARTHGLSGSPEYQSWVSMKARCLNPATEHYGLYGGRGITVCDRWLTSFANFYADMGERPEPKTAYSIDRIDTNGNYEPGNCKWSTDSEQASNRRKKT